MSQFFKALEQAERDRLRQDQPDGTATTPARPTPAEGAAHKADDTVSRGVVADEPAAEVASATVEAPVVDATKAPAARPSVRKPMSPRPVFRPQARPPAGPAPAGVFRPSLRTSERSRPGGGHPRPPLLIVQTQPNSIEAEAYRTVRTNIELMFDGTGCQHIAITSAAGGDGKSTSAANLAVVAAQAGRRVCLVDADLRRPTVHEIFGLRNVDGLASALEHGQPLQAVAQSTDIEGLSVVVAGRGAEERIHDLVISHRLETVLRQSDGKFDLVLFDSPPVTSVADALSIAAVCDGVILVVRAASVPFSVLRRAIGQITQVKGRVLGVLLNHVDLRATDSESYGYFRGYDARRTRPTP
jgi:capsular exopolysaccharide synthesis family protein